MEKYAGDEKQKNAKTPGEAMLSKLVLKLRRINLLPVAVSRTLPAEV